MVPEEPPTLPPSSESAARTLAELEAENKHLRERNAELEADVAALEAADDDLESDDDLGDLDL
jgi:hypothetical protein